MVLALTGTTPWSSFTSGLRCGSSLPVRIQSPPPLLTTRICIPLKYPDMPGIRIGESDTCIRIVQCTSVPSDISPDCQGNRITREQSREGWLYCIFAACCAMDTCVLRYVHDTCTLCMPGVCFRSSSTCTLMMCQWVQMHDRHPPSKVGCKKTVPSTMRVCITRSQSAHKMTLFGHVPLSCIQLFVDGHHTTRLFRCVCVEGGGGYMPLFPVLAMHLWLVLYRSVSSPYSPPLPPTHSSLDGLASNFLLLSSPTDTWSTHYSRCCLSKFSAQCSICGVCNC